MKLRRILILAATAWTAGAVGAQEKALPDSVSKELEEIVVKANQPTTKLVGSTLVSTIAGSRLQELGTALDVLAQLPMLKTEDGNVTVIGKGSPEIYIDGRPMRDGEELIQLQSWNIKSVELDMAPGLMYSSETKAVLKITTRNNFVAGLSLTERGEVKQGHKLSANDMLDLNYRRGGLDVFATGVVARNNSEIKGSTINTLTYKGKPTTVGSSQDKEYPTNTWNLKGGLNHSSGTQSLGAYYRYNHERGNFVNNGSEWLDNGPQISREIGNDIKGHSSLVSAYYDNKLADRYLIHFDGIYKDNRSTERTTATYPDGTMPDVTSTNGRKASLWGGKLYTSLPLAGGALTAGTEGSRTRTKLDFRMLNQEVGEYIPSSLSDSRQISAAVFASWSKTFGKLSIRGGARYEYSDYQFNINGKRDTEVSKKDKSLTPDIFLSYNFSEKSQVSLSYRLSRVKPPYSNLTGSLSYVGAHEIEGGNPSLRDEKMHNIQLFGMAGDFMIQANFAKSDDTYAFVKRLYDAPTLQLITQPINIDVTSADVFLIWSRRIGCWTPNVTAGMHKQWLKIEGQSYNKPIFSYYLDNMIALPRGFTMTINASGMSKGDMHTNRFGATAISINASISKNFFGKSLQVKLSGNDLLNSMSNDWEMDTYGVKTVKCQKYDIRNITLTATYRFQPRQSKYKGESASEAEMNRL